jgi:hypothetical protein
MAGKAHRKESLIISFVVQATTAPFATLVKWATLSILSAGKTASSAKTNRLTLSGFHLKKAKSVLTNAMVNAYSTTSRHQIPLKRI